MKNSGQPAESQGTLLLTPRELPVLPDPARRPPALEATKIGRYCDAWNVPPDAGWSQVGVLRYESRHDRAELAMDPCFRAVHPFKFAAIPAAAWFPTAPGLALLLGPRIGVGFVLALVAVLLT